MIPENFETTLPRELWPIALYGETIKADHCVVCGAHWPLNQHHIIFRSQGHLYLNGEEQKSPTITLCGFGNALSGNGKKPYCHGLAHHHLLHFRVASRDGKYQYEVLRTSEPTPYTEALKMGGWAPLAFGPGYWPEI